VTLLEPVHPTILTLLHGGSLVSFYAKFTTEGTANSVVSPYTNVGLCFYLDTPFLGMESDGNGGNISYPNSSA
jgi:hypothetical protein